MVNKLGMRTNYQFRLKLNKSIPNEVNEILNYLHNRNSNKRPEKLPNHCFFKCERWCIIYLESIPDDPRDKYYDQYLIFKGEIKNYDSEIEKCIDWLLQYCEDSFGDFIGIKQTNEIDNGWIQPIYLEGYNDD